MNLQRFNELVRVSAGRLGQSPKEWRYFLEFVDTYFKNRGILHPLVVEIGTKNNIQKSFYRELLGAFHIGIDIKGRPDILGNSRSPEMLARLKEQLNGRAIDLLFIDGDHTYAGVKTDYEIYGPLTKHIIAIHDISHPYSKEIPEETMRFWKEIVNADRRSVHLAIRHYNSATTGITAGRQMGIGLVIKEET